MFESDLASIIVDNTVTDEVLLLFQDTLNTIQDAIDARFGAGKFTDEFKRMLATNANKYLFLDPFAGEFVYKDRTLTFDGDTLLDEFTTGICDVIAQTVEHFRAQDENIIESVYSSIQPFKEERIELIDRLKLDMKMPLVFGDRIPVETESKEGEEEEDKGKIGGLSRFFKRKGKSSDE